METEENLGNRDPPTTHEEAEWEAQKRNFRRCYIDEKMALKRAAACMIERHRFHATVRQWERKVHQWGFHKYESREARIRHIQDGGPLDRNSRRFLRRHSRSRSVSPGVPSRSSGPQPSLNTSGIVGSNDPGIGGAGQTSLPFDPADFANQQTDRRFSPGNSDFSTQLSVFSNEPQYDPMTPMANEAIYDVVVSENVFGNENLSGPPSAFHLDAYLAQPDSENPVQLIVPTEQFSGERSVATHPQIQLTVWNDASEQFTEVPLDIDSHSPSSTQMTAEHPGLPLSPNEDVGQFIQQDSAFDLPPTISNSNNQAGFEMPRYGQDIDNPWNIPADQALMAQQDFGSESFENGGSQNSTPFQSQTDYPNIIEPFPDLSLTSPEQQFAMPYSNPIIDSKTIEQQRRRESELSESSPDTYQTDFVLSVGDYTNNVRDIVASFARAKNLPAADMENLNMALNAQRLSFVHGMKMRLETVIRSIQRTHQADRDMCRTLRQRDVILRQIMVEKGIDIKNEFNIRPRLQVLSSMLPQNLYSNIP